MSKEQAISNEQALNEARRRHPVSKEQATNEARRLFEKLQAGDMAGSGGAQVMADNIRNGLAWAGLDESTLDKEGKKSADDMRAALKEEEQKQEINESRRLLERLQAGDTKGYGGAKSMANHIRSKLARVGVDESRLDKTREKSAADMRAVLKGAETKQDLAEKEQATNEACRLFEKLQAGDTADYKSARFMADDIRNKLAGAERDESRLDKEGKKSADDMRAVLKATEKEQEINESCRLFERLQAGDTAGYDGADSMANHIRSKIWRLDEDVSMLDRKGGGKSADEMEAILRATAQEARKKEQEINEVRQLFGRLQKGDTAGYDSAEFMANDIRSRIRRVDADASVLDWNRKRPAAEMQAALREAEKAAGKLVGCSL